MWRYFSANNTNVYLDVLPKLINDYNNSKHRTIKMSPAEASNKKNESKVWNNLYGEIMAITKAKFKIGDKVHISKYKRMFEKGYTPNWTEEVFIIDKILQTNPITYELKYLTMNLLMDRSTIRNYKRQHKKCCVLKKSYDETTKINWH